MEPFLAPDWPDALCAPQGGYYAETWFPAPSEHGNEAKAICRRCPRLDECLERVMDLHRKGLPQAGIWGATTAHERKTLMVGAERICPDCSTVTGPPVRGRNPRCEECWTVRRAKTYADYNERRRSA
jgi:hypothetical protein